MSRRAPLLIFLSFILACGDDGGATDAGSSPNDSGTSDGGGDSDAGGGDSDGGEPTDGGSTGDAGPSRADAGVVPPMPEGIEIVQEFTFEENARFPEDDPNLVSVGATDDSLTLSYSGAPTIPLAAGHVVAGRLANGYLRRLTSVTESSPNVFEFSTENADLDEIIASGHARGTYNPPAESWTAYDDGVIVAPLDGAGAFSLIRDFMIGDAMCSAGGGLISINPSVDIDPIIEIDIEFDDDTGELVHALFVTGVQFEVGVSVDGPGTIAASCMANLLRNLSFETIVPIGPIPFKHTFSPIFSVNVGATGSAMGTFAASAVGTASLRMGVEFDGSEWTQIWEPNASGDTSFSSSKNGSIAVTGGFSAGFGYQAAAWGALGLSASITRQLSATFSLADCEWASELRSGINATVGASVMVPVVDITLASVSFSNTIAEEIIDSQTMRLDIPECRTYDIFSCGAQQTICDQTICGPRYYTVQQGDDPALQQMRRDLAVVACTEWFECLRDDGFNTACMRDRCEGGHSGVGLVMDLGGGAQRHRGNVQCNDITTAEVSASAPNMWWPGNFALISGDMEPYSATWSLIYGDVSITGECPGTTPCVDRLSGACRTCM